MNAIKISWTLEKLPCCGAAERGGSTTFSFRTEAGRLVCSILYTAHAEPLHLTAKIQPADRIDILLLPYRIELYRNGILTDEEWPEGQLLLTIADKICSDVPLRIEEIAPEQTPEEPMIQGTLRDAEGWRPEEHVFVGDCMPYVRDGVYHVLYLKDRHHHRSKWGLGAHQWAHLSTSDFATWSVHPMAVPITDPDEGSVCTGSWIRRGTTDYLFYTIRKSGGRPAPIGRSLSKDGYHFEKDPTFGFVLPEQYCQRSARDPKVICGADGCYHMFLTTSLLKEQKGCLAHLVSTDLDRFRFHTAGMPGLSGVSRKILSDLQSAWPGSLSGVGSPV